MLTALPGEITDGNAVFPGPKREDVVAKSRRSLDGSCLSRPPAIIWSQLGTAREHLEAAGDHLGAAGSSWRPHGGPWKPFGSQSGRLSHYLLQIVTSTFKCAHLYAFVHWIPPNLTFIPLFTYQSPLFKNVRKHQFLHAFVRWLKTLLFFTRLWSRNIMGWAQPAQKSVHKK